MHTLDDHGGSVNDDALLGVVVQHPIAALHGTTRVGVDAGPDRPRDLKPVKGRGEERRANRNACFVGTLTWITGISHGQVAEGGAGIHEVETNTHGRGIFDEGVVKPGTGGVDLQGSVADVGRLGVRPTGAGDGQVGEVGGFVIRVVRVVVFVHVHATVHGIADVRIANDGVGVATVVDVANHDARVGR